jgi:carboxyl-terminal processing protease
MQSKVLRNVIVFLLVFVIVTGVFAGGMIVGWALPQSRNLGLLLVPGLVRNTSTSSQVSQRGQNIDTLFKPFWEAWDIVHQQYIDQPVDDVKLMRGAISGMMTALGDKHSSYMDPEQFSQANAPLVGGYEGIGAYVDTTTGDFLTITKPMPGSPAEKAGLQAGDKIVGIDGQDMTGIDPLLVLRKVLGPAGSTVKLSVLREGQEKPFDVDIVRAKIVLPSVESKMLDKNVAYVRLNTFGSSTANDLRKSLTDLMAKKPAGLVLDLRDNGGGYLVTAIDVISEFIPSGKVAMVEVKADGTRDTFYAKNGGKATDIPLVVLVNENTASASEITAGAIQDYVRGKLVGVTTYGKGSVQNWIPLIDNQGAVRVTIARWLTPKERQIDKIGLTPDVVVTMTADDIKANRDPQLDKAIELLTTPQ